MAEYVALLSKEPDSDYGVDFPDFPGCVTAGATPEEVRELALEALCLHIEGMIQEGEHIPAPSSIDEVRPDKLNTDVVGIFLVTVPDDLVTKSEQDIRKEGIFKMESCDLSWRNLDAP
ncbi:MAG: type II toxin-antitoxin system HicB family antitoxin [Thermodesulfobacteriota bacterium]